MYVVHVVRQFYPGVGGLENHVLDLARAQVAAGDRIRVVTWTGCSRTKPKNG